MNSLTSSGSVLSTSTMYPHAGHCFESRLRTSIRIFSAILSPPHFGRAALGLQCRIGDVRIGSIVGLVPGFHFKDLIHVLNWNVERHVSARGEGVAHLPAGRQTDDRVFTGIDDPERESEGQFEIATEAAAILQIDPRSLSRDH